MLTKPTYDVDNVQQLPDLVQDNPSLVKQTMDKVGSDTKIYLVALCDEIDTELATKDELQAVVTGGISDGSVTDAKLSNEAGQLKSVVAKALAFTGTDLITWLNTQTQGGYFSFTNTVTDGVPFVGFFNGFLEFPPTGNTKVTLTSRVSPYKTYINVRSSGIWLGWIELSLKSDLDNHIGDLITDTDGAHGFKEERGSFTPVLLGATTAGTPVYASQAGQYLRQGKNIIYAIQIQISSKGGMAGNLRISGLPFTSSGYATKAIGIERIENWTKPANLLLLTPTFATTSLMELRFSQAGGVGVLQATDVLDTLHIRLSGSYEIA